MVAGVSDAVKATARVALAFTFAGPAGGLLEGGRQAVDLLDGYLRKHRQGYEQALSRVRDELLNLAQVEQVDEERLELAFTTTRDLFETHALTAHELAELAFDEEKAAAELRDRGWNLLRSAGLDEPTSYLCRRAVLACYRAMLADSELLPGRDDAFQRTVLEVVTAIRAGLSGLTGDINQLADLPNQVRQELRALHTPAEVDWPVQVGTPPLAAIAFQPRHALLKPLTSDAAGGPAPAVVLTGLMAGDGGVGKSQLAAAMFRQAADDGIQLRVWLNAADRASVVAGLASTCARLGLPVPAAEPAEQAEAAVRVLLGWLATTDRSWFVVYDDVADPGALTGLWPQGKTGQLLVTTRRQDLQLAGATRIPVGVYTAEESLAYLTDRLTGPDSGPYRSDVLDEAGRLAEDLGHLPLALAQAAAVISLDRSSCAEYRALLADRTTRLPELFPEIARADDYPYTVVSAWSLAIDRADQLGQSTPSVHDNRQDAVGNRQGQCGIASVLLEFAALLDPSGIPLRLFQTNAVLDYLHYRLAGCMDWPTDDQTAQRLVRRGLTNLQVLSLIAIENELIRVHGIVQRVVSEAAEDSLADTIWAAADALFDIWPAINLHQGEAALLRQNATALGHRHNTALLDPATHPVLYRAARSLADAGQLAAATASLQQLHDDCLRVLGPHHPSTMATRNNLAYLRGEAGDTTGAVAELGHLLTDQLRTLGPNHPSTLTTRNNLATLRGRSGDTTGAVAEFEHLLTDQLRVLGPNHPDILITRNNLARWRGEAGEATGAVAEFERLLIDRLQVLGPDHPDTLTTRNNLAVLRGEAGDTAGAVAELEKLLTDRLQVLGPDHPDTLTTRNNLASWRGEAGETAGAVAELEKLLTDRLRVLGPDHPDTLTTRNNLASWRGEAGDTAGAAAEFEHLLTDQLRVLGPDHPDTLTTRNNLAYMHARAGDAAAAEFEQLLTDRLRVLGPDHPDTLTTRNNLAYMHARAGDAAGAAAAAEQLLTDQLRVLGPDHPDTLTTRNNLANWRGETGDTASAATELQQLLTDQLRVLGPDHPGTVATRNNLAHWQSQS